MYVRLKIPPAPELVDGVSPATGFGRAEAYRRRPCTGNRSVWRGRFTVHGNAIDVRVACARRYALETAESHVRHIYVYICIYIYICLLD